jgi:hypothetical protein
MIVIGASRLNCSKRLIRHCSSADTRKKLVGNAKAVPSLLYFLIVSKATISYEII